MSEKPTYEELERRVRALQEAESERTQTQEALRASEKLYRILFEQARDVIYVTTPEGHLIDMNDAGLELMGYPRQEFKQIDVADHHTDPAQREAEKRELHEKGFIKDKEIRLIKQDGSEIVCLDSATVLRTPDGSVQGYIGTLRDISEARRAEEALQKSEEDYRAIFDSANDALFIHHIETGEILSVNRKMCEMYGYSKEEVGHLSIGAISEGKPPYTQEDALKWVRRAVDGAPQLFEWKARDKAGRIFWVEVNLKQAVIGGENRLLAIVRDITDRKLAEEEKKGLQNRLTQAQKMESIGTLAGGIAHNFNNILMGIQGRASLMMLDKPSSHPDVEHLRGIEQYVKSAVELTRDLLGFARGGKYEVQPTDLNALIKHENRVFGRTKKEISVHGKYEPNLWPVDVDRGQIQQALLNLYVNAWQAMPEGGDLWVQTENMILDDPQVQPFEIAPGRYVKISVTDTGTGMDASTREKIFDPFFSTRGAGQGSGLGLASVYGIVKNHGGFINVYSEPGEGTSFHLHLPASDSEVTQEEPKPGRRRIQYGKGTVLLVDDEEMILAVGRKMLESLGYQALTARSGKEALEVYRRQGDRIDLVVLDMIMPGMGGGETYDRMRAVDETVKVLLSSGYSLSGQAEKILDRGCRGFIQKPFSLQDLSIKLREALYEAT